MNTTPECDYCAAKGPLVKTYIAGPMTGCQNFNRDNFDAISHLLAAKGHLPLNPAAIRLQDEAGWQTYMRTSLTVFLQADQILLLPGWKSSKGAQVEYDLACTLGIPVYVLPDALQNEYTPVYVMPGEELS